MKTVMKGALTYSTAPQRRHTGMATSGTFGGLSSPGKRPCPSSAADLYLLGNHDTTLGEVS